MNISFRVTWSSKPRRSGLKNTKSNFRLKGSRDGNNYPFTYEGNPDPVKLLTFFLKRQTIYPTLSLVSNLQDIKLLKLGTTLSSLQYLLMYAHVGNVVTCSKSCS